MHSPSQAPHSLIFCSRAASWVWRRWWPWWRPRQTPLLVSSASRVTTLCVCLSWSVWRWWVVSVLLRCVASGRGRRTEGGPNTLWVWSADQAGAESYEWEEVRWSCKATRRVGDFPYYFFFLNKFLATTPFLDTLPLISCRSFESNWNIYKILAFQKPVKTEVTALAVYVLIEWSGN